MIFMGVNIFILFKLGAFAIDAVEEDAPGIILEDQQEIEEQDL